MAWSTESGAGLGLNASLPADAGPLLACVEPGCVQEGAQADGEQARQVRRLHWRSLRVAAGLAVAALAAAEVLIEGHAHFLAAQSANASKLAYSAFGNTVSYFGATEAPLGSCAIPKNFCTGEQDRLMYRDCDGDNVKDPYCEDAEQLRFGYFSSKHDCRGNWPDGVCLKATEPGGENFEPDKVLPAASNEITIIHFNDVYQVAGVVEDGERKGGMSRAAFVINQERLRNPERTFVVFAGDLLSPSVLSDMFKGAQMVDVLNRLGLDAASLGNHEFDFGLDVFLQRVKESKFPWLNTNLLDAKTGEILPGTQKHLVRKVRWAPRWGEGEAHEDLKVCLFGAAYDVRESIFKDADKISHADTIATAKKEAKELRDSGCDVILALTHQFSAEDCKMAVALQGTVDLILGGHDHKTEFNTNCGNAPYVKADSDLKTQWVMSLFIGDDGKVESVEGRLLELTSSDPFNQSTHHQVIMWEERGMAEMGREIGCSAVDMDARPSLVRTEETAIGNFVTDAVRAFHKTDVVVWNTGGIRGTMYHKGPVSKLTMSSIHPFGNTIVMISAKGKHLRDFLEDAIKCWDDLCGNFPAVSGLAFSFDPMAPAGRRLKDIWYPAGAPLADDATVTVALPDFVWSTWPPFTACPLYGMVTANDAVPLVTALTDYVTKAGKNCIAPAVDGRMRKMEPGTAAVLRQTDPAAPTQ